MFNVVPVSPVTNCLVDVMVSDGEQLKYISKIRSSFTFLAKSIRAVSLPTFPTYMFWKKRRKRRKGGEWTLCRDLKTYSDD